MIPKSMSSTPIGDGYRFSDKIMRNEAQLALMSVIAFSIKSVIWRRIS